MSKSRILSGANNSLNAIRENKILANISEFTVHKLDNIKKKKAKFDPNTSCGSRIMSIYTN